MNALRFFKSGLKINLNFFLDSMYAQKELYQDSDQVKEVVLLYGQKRATTINFKI